MIDKKVTITEGLLNLAKIQNEMYTVKNRSQNQQTVAQLDGSGGKTRGSDKHTDSLFLNSKKTEKFQAALNQFEEKHLLALQQKSKISKKSRHSGNDHSNAVEERLAEGSDDTDQLIEDPDDEKEQGEHREEDEEDEFEKFNQEFLKQHEKMIEEISNRNKEKLN